MNKFLFTIVFGAVSLLINAQILQPVKWSYSHEQVSENEYKLVFKAKIDDGWYVYSQNEVEDGPIPTSFSFDENSDVDLVGSTAETGEKIKEGLDPVFDTQIKKFGKSATFTQKVKLSANSTLTGFLEFMTCDDERCLPPEAVDFSFDLKLVPTEEPVIEEIETPVKDEGQSIKEEKKNLSGSTDEIIDEKNVIPAEVTQIEETQEDLNGIFEKEGEQGILDPVKWEIFAENISETETKVNFKATIDKGWYLYSQFIEEGGPVPTTFYADENFEKIIEFEEVSDDIIDGFDKIFEMDVRKFKNKVLFSKVFPKSKGQFSGVLDFMTCTDGRCLPPASKYYKSNLVDLVSEISDNPFGVSSQEYKDDCSHLNLGISKNLNKNDEKKEESAWIIFLLGFGGGLLALLTPCVFPMIPLTVSFFTKSSQTKNGKFQAILYGFSIFLIYVLLSAPFHLLDLAPTVLHQISTGVVLNLIFFAIFVFFAFSFFGYYEITLPSGLANRVSKAENTGGILGVFFMALTLAIVSFSCTGPIIGSLLAGTLTKGAWLLTIGMAGFGIALGLPFALFALFPSMLNKLPQSGGWMNTVKVILGFLELALAFKFLSNADLVHNWGLLKREVFFGIWVLIALLMGLYMIGVIKFPHDSPIKKLKPSRIILAIIFFGFGVYFAPGLFGKNVPLLSGFAPPMYYKIFKGEEKDNKFQLTDEVKKKYGFSDKCPNGIPCMKDYFKSEEYGLDYSKPVLIDFTGFACVNCRRMEEQVWIKENITEILGNQVTLASLYVDDRTELSEDELCVGVYGEDVTQNVRNVGLKWSFFEIINFEQNSQPLYVMIDPRDREILMQPVGYTPDAKEYERLLLEGVEKYHSKNL